MDPSHESYVRLRNAAKEISGLSEAELDAAIFYSGADNTRPHENIHDLLLLCATNLANRGGPFPKPAQVRPLFERVFEQVFAENQSIPAREDFFGVIIEQAQVLHNQVGWTLTQVPHGTGCEPLQAALGQAPYDRRTPIISISDGTYAFAEMLNARYDLNARSYSESLGDLQGCQTHHPKLQRFRLALEELLGLPSWGAALSANFLKDSQILKLAELPDKHKVASAHSVYVKPDLHLFRFMARLTGRRTDFNGKRQDYDYAPARQHVWDGNCDRWPYNELQAGGEANRSWRCIQDVNYWASQAGVSAVAIDRLLYMCGSGNFPGTPLGPNSGGPLGPNHGGAAMNQAQRYEIVERHLIGNQ